MKTLDSHVILVQLLDVWVGWNVPFIKIEYIISHLLSKDKSSINSDNRLRIFGPSISLPPLKVEMPFNPPELQKSEFRKKTTALYIMSNVLFLCL